MLSHLDIETHGIYGAPARALVCYGIMTEFCTWHEKLWSFRTFLKTLKVLNFVSKEYKVELFIYAIFLHLDYLLMLFRTLLLFVFVN